MDTIERILDLIMEKGLPESLIVREVSLSNGVIGQWRKRKQNPSAEAIVKLAKYFCVTTDYLLCLSDEKTTAKPVKRIEREVEISDDVKELFAVYQQLDTSGKRQLLGKAYKLLDKRG